MGLFVLFKVGGFVGVVGIRTFNFDGSGVVTVVSTGVGDASGENLDQK